MSRGLLLRALAIDTGLDLVWAITWQRESNERIGPAIGLPRLAGIRPRPASTIRWRPKRDR